ncbi:MAG: HAD hydrolase-like protein [Anaerolineae bacterium]|nr:HAD hydrolase-like protein [Anaerolineae bacterium]
MTRLILFDIDGTLLLTQGAGRESTRRAMTEVFGTAGDIDAHHFSGKTDWQTLSELLEGQHTREDIGAILPSYNETVGRHISAIISGFAVTPTPGALEAVNQLRARPDISLGVLTGNASRAAEVKLRAGGFDPAWFPAGAFGHEAFHRNDLPELAIQRARAHYGYDFPLSDIIIIGDTIMDIACARAAGVVAAVVLTGFETPAALEAAQPDAIFETLSEFAAWV